MNRRPRNISLLFISIIGISILGWYIHSIQPETTIAIVGFFLLFFVTLCSFSLFVLNNVRRALLITAGITIYLLLRIFELTEPMYIILLLATLISFEWVFSKK